MTEPNELMTIGDFARAVGLTPKALRLYDDLGLLRPAEVDAYSGYRRYVPMQLERARTVARLRLIGMPLARIKHVLDLAPAQAAQELETYWVQVEADTTTRRQLVATLVNQLRNEEPAMTTTTTHLHAEYGTSHRQGHRDKQQDALLVTPDLFAVADGFGDRDDLAGPVLTAYAEGGLPAAIAVVAPQVTAALPDQPASGTTLTAVRLTGSTAQITHVGDARVWLARDGELRQLTHDHTIVAALIETGQLTTEEARSHKHRHLLNRALTPGVVADETTVDLRPGDRLVLTTDGIHTYVDDLETMLTTSESPQHVADAAAAAAADAGEPDNHTIVVVDLS